MFKLDPVFVSVFRAEDRAVQDRARAVERRLSTALAERHLVVDLAEVPPFEDYSAEIYLDSCPADRAAGCAYVIGARAKADWAVSGEVSAAPDDAAGAVVVDTAIVDVVASRVVVRFQVRLAEGDPADAYATAVADLIDRLSREGTDPEDVREETDAQVAARREEAARAEREAVAASLDALETELGTLQIRSRDQAVEAPRLSQAEVKALARGEAPPWERLGLTAGQYRRMRNAGSDAVTWRRRLQGREGRIVVRGTLGGGYGPWETRYDGRWAVDASVGEVVEVDAFQEVTRGAGWGAGGEVGLGLLPWVDVTLEARSRLATYDYLLHPETVGDARTPDEATRTPVGTLEVGGRVTVVGVPTSRVRPLGTAGASLWLGPSLDQVVQVGVPEVPRFEAPRVVFVHAGPGVEVEASSALHLFARVEGWLPVAGGSMQQEQSGDEVLVHRGEPLGGGGLGWTVAAGVQGLFGPLWGGDDRRRRP